MGVLQAHEPLITALSTTEVLVGIEVDMVIGRLVWKM